MQDEPARPQPDDSARSSSSDGGGERERELAALRARVRTLERRLARAKNALQPAPQPEDRPDASSPSGTAAALRFLADAGRELGSLLDLNAIPHELVEIAVPFLADFCAVDLFDAEGNLGRTAFHHVDPVQEAHIHDLRRRYPLVPVTSDPTRMLPIQRAAHLRRSELFSDFTAELHPEAASDAGHLAALRALHIRSAMSVPLLARSRCLGAVTFAITESDRRYTTADLAIAEELAGRASLALDNARLLDAISAHAARLQALAETSREFGEASLDIDTLLDRFVRRISSLVGDGCSVRLLSHDGRWLDPAAVYHRNPEALAALLPLVMGQPMPADFQRFGDVVRTGEPVILRTITPEIIAGWRTARFWPYFEQFPESSVVLLPLRSRGRVIGVLRVSRGVPSPPYTDDDIHLLNDLADRAALAIENASLYREAQTAEAKYRNLFDGAADAILITHPSGHLTDANPAAVNLFGYTRDELLGLSSAVLIQQASDWTLAQRERLMHDGSWQGEMEVRRRDGGVVPVEVSAAVIDTALGRQHVSFIRDISERRAHEQAQRDFIAMVTHELKAPLTALKGFAQMAQRREDVVERNLASIVEQANHLDRLINDLLDAARAEVRQLDLRRRHVSLVDLVTAAIERARAGTQTHRIRLEAPSDPVMGWWDADRIGQVCANLLSNAIKYSPRNDPGEIIVRVEKLPLADQALVSVTDSGTGIAPEALPRLFDRFYRAPGERRMAGLGLGLYIARSLVEAHGGRIWAESTVGQGSTFTFTLPLGDPPAED